MADGAVLVVDDIVVRYGATTAVRGASLTARRGEIVALVGANGAGKTTTMRAIVGLRRCSQGRIWLEGADITGLSPERITRRSMTLTPEGREIFARLTVEENLRMGAGFASRELFRTRRESVFELFPVLEAKRAAFAGVLSGGEQQQLAIARSLMSDPRVLLLDEPSLGLAPILVGQIFKLIVSLRDRGCTIVLAEQNARKALEIADRAYVLHMGRVQLEGNAEKLREDPQVEQAYLGVGLAV